MKVVQQTPNLLILRKRPVVIWVLGIVFASVGLFVLTNLGKVTTLTCSRTESANCQLVSSGLLGAHSKQIPLNMLQDAKVEESTDSNDSTYYRAIILTIRGEVPFTSYSSSGESDKQAIVSQINNFISNPEITSLRATQDDRLWMYLFGGVFFAVGLIVLLLPVVTCIFDKTQDTLTLKRQGLLGTKVIEHRLHEIKDVFVDELTDSDSGSTYRVTIVLTSGSSLPVTTYYTNGRNSMQEAASCIKSFLNLNN